MKPYSLDSQVNLTYLSARRAVELAALLLLLPTFLVIATLVSILIKIDSHGPVLFCQMRPGQNGKLFLMYKFRSMKHAANDTYLTLKDDARITRVGKIIRRYHLDELPQLINIFKGEMSLIGPRPVPASYLEIYKKEIRNYDLRHLVKPGIAGLAQVKLGYTSSVQEEKRKLRYDLLYIKRASLRLDLLILLCLLSIPKD